MPRRRPLNGLDIMDDIVEKAVDVAFDRGAEFFQRAREKQVAHLPAEARVQAYTCMGCKRSPFTLEQMEVISAPMPGFGMCKGCFAFAWAAGKEKVRYLTKKAQEVAQARGPGPMQEPVARPPWVILGVEKDASVEDIKKAWRALAAKYHPDMVPPGPNATDERDAARLKFEEVTRARDVMIKLRQPAAAG